MTTQLGLLPVFILFFILNILERCSSNSQSLLDQNLSGDGSVTDIPKEDDTALAFGDFATADKKVCANIKLDSMRVIPTVYLLIDQSRSMETQIGSLSRWEAVHKTLMDSTGGLVTKLQANIRFGLALYTSKYGSLGGLECPLITEVIPSLDNAAAIDQIYQQASPVQDTPTGDAIDVIRSKLGQITEAGPKIIVLATDGMPDTCADPEPEVNGTIQQTAQAALDATQRAFAQGIKTYIISVGDGVTEIHLQHMANVGAGLPPQGGAKAEFFKGSNLADLEAAFSKVMKRVSDCRFTLNGRVDLYLAKSGQVTFDGTS